MVHRISTSQIRSKLRQTQVKQKQAIDKYNRAVRTYNQKVKSAVNRYNQDINQYNSRVRAHNNRVRANCNRLQKELDKLARITSSPTQMKFRTSVEDVYRTYTHLESAAKAHHYGDHYNQVLDLSKREAANTTSVMNAILGNPERLDGHEDISSTTLDPILSLIGTDLPDRWHGALFSLNPNNPDAARHFCTSSREILTRILDSYAPNSTVLAEMPYCEKMPDGSPTRRSKIRFFLYRNNMNKIPLENFVEEDMRNIIQLFREVNDGTHGTAGRFSLDQLLVIKNRVEHAVEFLWNIVPDDLRNPASQREQNRFTHLEDC